MHVSFTRKSSNAKTGPIPVTTSARETCPASCPFIGKQGGCYAEAGFYTRVHWDKVSDGTRGGTWSDLCAQVESLPAGQVWRHNIAGDLPHNDGAIDLDKMGPLTRASQHTMGFTYTHHAMTDHNMELISLVNAAPGFVVNLSANDLDHADALYDLGIAPVAVVMPSNATENVKTPQGRRVVICPAIARDDVTCATCKLCARRNRKTIVGFPAHGGGKKHADKVVSGGWTETGISVSMLRSAGFKG